MKVRIIANPMKPWATKTALEVKKVLRMAGHDIAGSNPDATICIGGDGTILFAGYKGNLKGKILGIGSRRSYICQLHRSNWRRKLPRILKENTEKVYTLQYAAGRMKHKAINDVVIHTNDYRVLDLGISIGRKRREFSADGIIVSSAIGSSAYAYSAGGKKLCHRSKLMQIVPIAPYRRAFSPRPVSSRETIRVTPRRACALIVDGIYIKELKPNETIIIRQDGALRFFKGVGRHEQG